MPIDPTTRGKPQKKTPEELRDIRSANARKMNAKLRAHWEAHDAEHGQPKRKPAKPKRKPSERTVCAFRVSDAEAKAIDALVAEVNECAKARRLAPFLKSDILRAAVLEWAGRSSARNAQGKAVAEHVGDTW